MEKMEEKNCIDSKIAFFTHWVYKNLLNFPSRLSFNCFSYHWKKSLNFSRGKLTVENKNKSWIKNPLRKNTTANDFWAPTEEKLKVISYLSCSNLIVEIADLEIFHTEKHTHKIQGFTDENSSFENGLKKCVKYKAILNLHFIFFGPRSSSHDWSRIDIISGTFDFSVHESNWMQNL